MDTFIAIIVLLLILANLILYIYYNVIKKIILKIRIKRIKADDNTNMLLYNLKNILENDSVYKKIQFKMKQIKIPIICISCILSIIIIFPIIYSIVYIMYLFERIDKIFIFKKDFATLLMVLLFFFLIILIYLLSISTIIENNKDIKQNIYRNFIKRLNYNIKWQDLYETRIPNNILTFENSYSYLKSSYKKANCNLINNSFSSMDIGFSEILNGIFKEKYPFSVSFFEESSYKVHNRTFGFIRYFLHEGIFCSIKMPHSLFTDIKITNNKVYKLINNNNNIIKTQNTTFNKDFILLSKDIIDISKSFTPQFLEIINNYYKTTKMKFEISIIDDQLLFIFNDFTPIIINTWGNIVDYQILKCYSNILSFITQIIEELEKNNN